MGVWLRLREAFQRRIRQRVTAAGFWYSGATVVVGVGAFLSGNNLLFLLLAVMLATLLVSGLVSRLGLAGLHVSFELPDHVTARVTVGGRVVVRNTKSWMPSFSIRAKGSPDTGMSAAVYFPVIRGGSAAWETVEVRFARRGVYERNSIEFHTSFPFGFADRHASVRLEHQVLVYPCLDPVPAFENLLASITGEMATRHRSLAGDFYRIRPYESNESARHVDWRATAHTGTLQVREFAREEDPRLELYLDLECPEGPAFERAVDCAAFLAWRTDVRGGRLRFRTQGFDVTVPEQQSVYTILKYLAVVKPQAARRQDASAVELDDQASFKVAITADPKRLAGSGFRIVDIAELADAGAGSAGAGEDGDHGGGRDHGGNTGQHHGL